jgi:Dolichyl-phosphate-mannose-protein mannosyltransferase
VSVVNLLGWERRDPVGFRHAAMETAAFVATVALAVGLYALLQAPVLNPESYLDPWIYTALFTNFSYLYHAFTWAYWTSRLPWIIPGIAANRVLPPIGAFFVLHLAFFIGGATFAYLLARSFFGNRVALASVATLMMSPLYFDAHSNDYPDGATITYLLGAAYFAIGSLDSRRRLLRLAAAGFCAAAAFGTQIYAAVAIVGLIFVYLTVTWGSSRFLLRVLQDLAAAAAGALVLLAACGTVARTHGGEFLFFMPSWRYAHSIQLSRWQRPGHEWMLRESQLLIPPFVFGLVVLLIARTRLRGWRRDSGLRLATGGAVFLLYMIVFLSVWEFWYGGDFFEVYYYFSLFLVPTAIVLPAGIYLLTRTGCAPQSRSLAAAALGAAALPVLLVYRWRVALVDQGGFEFAGSLAAVALVLAAMPWSRHGRLRATMALGAVVLVVFTVGYAGASGYTTRAVFSPIPNSFTTRRASLSMAMQLISFMRTSRLQTIPAPAFWYNGSRYPALNGIQSTYLWGITWVGREMPRIDAGMRTLLEQRRPPNIVFLCAAANCSGAAQVLEHAGYRLRRRARGVIASHGEHFYVVAYAIAEFKPLDPVTAWYTAGAAALSRLPSGVALNRWRLSPSVPKGWWLPNGMQLVRGVPQLVTSERPWDYELVSPTKMLAPGSYGLYLRGQVVTGGLDLGVLDVRENRWIAQRMYWQRQRGFERGWMFTPFRLSTPTEVRFVLSNWVPHAATSRWRLQELRLLRFSS